MLTRPMVPVAQTLITSLFRSGKKGEVVVNFCFMLCHLCTGAVPVSAEPFGEGSASRLLSRADCVGNESSLLQCPTTPYSGGGCVTSGVACQGEHS